jgi:hypothetical protein
MDLLSKIVKIIKIINLQTCIFHMYSKVNQILTIHKFHKNLLSEKNHVLVVQNKTTMVFQG